MNIVPLICLDMTPSLTKSSELLFVIHLPTKEIKLIEYYMKFYPGKLVSFV